MSKHDDNTLLPPKEAARALKISQRTLARYRLEGKIPFIKLSNRKFLYLQSDIDQLIEDKYEEALPYCL